MSVSQPVSARTTALATLVAGLLALVALGALGVPWDAVPGGPLTPKPPAVHFGADELRRMESLSASMRLLGWISTLLSVAVALLLGLSPLGARLVPRTGRRWHSRTWARAGCAVLVVEMLMLVVTLPVRWRAHRVLVEYRLRTQSTSEWLRDLAVGRGLGLAFTLVLVWALLVLVRRAPRRWPAIAATGLAGTVLLVSFGWPLAVEPLYNDFEPMPPGPLRSEVLALAEREHVRVDDVLVADASRRTSTLNAYVSGYGSSRRVVVYDNLIADEPPAEVLTVVAHELAHARHHDVIWGTALGAAGAVIGVGLLGLLWPSAGLRRRAGLRGGEAVADPRAVPLLLALVVAGSFLSTPAQSLVSRQFERRADVSALRATHDPEAFIAMQRQLALRSLSDPAPPRWLHWWSGTHPTTGERIAIAERLAD